MYRGKYSPSHTLGHISLGAEDTPEDKPKDKVLDTSFVNLRQSAKKYGGVDSKKQMIATTATIWAASSAAGPYGWAVALVATALQFIPGVSKFISKVFKKATHMESCMNWWTDSNIMSMSGKPYNVVQLSYYSEDSEQMKRFQAKIKTPEQRQARVSELFLKIVKSVPDVQQLFQMQCASMPQGQKETKAGIDPNMVADIWNRLRKIAQDAEYEEVMAIVNSAKLKLIQTKRESNLLIPSVSANASTKPGEKPGVPFTFPIYTSGGSLIHDVGPAIINKGFPVVPKVK